MSVSNAPPMELLVHGTLKETIVIPSFHGHPLELWVEKEPSLDFFSSLVGKQVGATVQHGRVWLFRPVPMAIRDEDGQVTEVNRMIAFDAGPLTEDEIVHMRMGGLKVRYRGSNRSTLLVTQEDVIELPPILPVSVNISFSAAEPVKQN